MAAYPLRAIVLRKTKLGETDVILTLLAEDGRQVRAVAKGLRRPGSRFGGCLEPYSIVDLLLHTGRSLEMVTEVRTVIAHGDLRADIERSTASAVVCDLIDKVGTEGQVEPRLFGLVEATLAAFESARAEALDQLVVAFLVKALALQGYRPELTCCVACAEQVVGGGFSLDRGGVVCPACGAIDPATLRFPAEARAWLEVLLQSTMLEVAALKIPAAAVEDCFTLMRSFVNYHISARLKALDFYAATR